MINQIDVENINKELKAREASNYEFTDGGTINIESLKGLSDATLKDMKEEFLKWSWEKEKQEELEEFHSLAQKMFDVLPEIEWIPIFIIDVPLV